MSERTCWRETRNNKTIERYSLKFKNLRLVMSPNSVGMRPFNSFLARFRCVRAVKRENSEGIRPWRLLPSALQKGQETNWLVLSCCAGTNQKHCIYPNLLNSSLTISSSMLQKTPFHVHTESLGSKISSK